MASGSRPGMVPTMFRDLAPGMTVERASRNTWAHSPNSSPIRSISSMASLLEREKAGASLGPQMSWVLRLLAFTSP